MTILAISILYTAFAYGFYVWLQRSACPLSEEWEEPTWVRTDPKSFLSAREWPPYRSRGRAA